MCAECGSMSCQDLRNDKLEIRPGKDLLNGHLEKREEKLGKIEKRSSKDLLNGRLERRSGGNLSKLEDENSFLLAELSRLRIDNVRLQERNIIIAKELAVKTRDCSTLLEALDKHKEKGDGNQSRPSFSREVSRDGPVHVMPGDSYPGVGASLEKSDDGLREETPQENVRSKSEDRLLARLERGGSRMEQIKRQLVVQRGAIVAALRMVAAGKTRQMQSLGEEREEGREELDRAIGSIQILQSTPEGGAQCPMCEAFFPPATHQEDFEQHVMDHFSYDSDQDTLQYYAEEDHHTPM